MAKLALDRKSSQVNDWLRNPSIEFHNQAASSAKCHRLRMLKIKLQDHGLQIIHLGFYDKNAILLQPEGVEGPPGNPHDLY